MLKNVTQNIGRPSLHRFRWYCARAAEQLTSGASLGDILRDTKGHGPRKSQARGQKVKERHGQSKLPEGNEMKGSTVENEELDGYGKPVRNSPGPSASRFRPPFQRKRTEERA
jgi:hypothetical protein